MLNKDKIIEKLRDSIIECQVINENCTTIAQDFNGELFVNENNIVAAFNAANELIEFFEQELKKNLNNVVQ